VTATLSVDARAAAARARLAPIAAEYPFTPRFHVHPDGVAQHYVDEGPRGARAVLFVHGNPTWSFAWRRSVRELAPRARCVAVDHVGCGLSDKPGAYAYRLARHVENLERLVSALGLERLVLVLHDWGGPIGLGFARRHPELVERLVLLNTAAFPLTGTPERGPGAHDASAPGETSGSAGAPIPLPLRLSACRVPVLGTLAVRGLNAFARAATWMAVEKPLAPVVKRGYLLPYDSWQNRVATHAFVADIPLAPGDPSWAELMAIEAALSGFADRPVRILWGERDWVFTPRFRAEWQRRFPQAETTRFEHAGHYLFEDEAAAVADAIARAAAP